MASQTRSAGAGTSTGSGSVSWTNPGNVTASDGANATASPIANSQASTTLEATSFGFSIPGGATIDGIEVDITRHADLINLADLNATLVVGGSTAGTPGTGTTSSWPLFSAIETYGGAADTWGLTLSSSDINASNFGAAFQVVNNNASANSGYVDYIAITVFYTGGNPDPFPAGYEQAPQVGQKRYLWPHMAMRERLTRRVRGIVRSASPLILRPRVLPALALAR